MDVDVVVIGMGPGGEDTASRLARAGLTVAGVEGRLTGGECPYYACVPTKMMIRAANALAEGHRIDELAGTAAITSAFAPVATRIRDEATDNWDDAAAVRRFGQAGGHFVRGWGRISAPGEVTVETPDGSRIFHPRKAIVLNPGTAPAIPDISGLAGTPYWTNRDAVAVTTPPESLIIVGGGPVGCEFAQVFARFGTKVTVLAAPRLVPREEPEASKLLADVFAREGITVLGAAVEVSYDGTQFTVKLRTGEALHASNILLAAGRSTDLGRLGVAAIGLDARAHTIDVDEYLRAADGVYAIGDITGKGAFTHMSMYQARIAAEHILGRPVAPANYRAVPRVTFTDPEIGAVGQTESQAREAGIAVRTAITEIPDSTRGWIHKSGNDGFIKLVADTRGGVLVGATSMGPAGGEVLSALAVAIHAQVPVDSLRTMIYAYPTFHRAIEAALHNLDNPE